jgi:hypothetical protein
LRHACAPPFPVCRRLPSACKRESPPTKPATAQASLSLEFQWPFMGEKSKMARQEAGLFEWG